MTLEYQFDQLCNKFREGSHATQANRKAMLKLFTEQLAKNGYDVKTDVVPLIRPLNLVL